MGTWLTLSPQNLSSFQRRGTFVAHQHGANALLQLRTVEQYYSNPVSARLYEVAYAQMVNAKISETNLIVATANLLPAAACQSAGRKTPANPGRKRC
jgi:hypothetical protein